MATSKVTEFISGRLFWPKIVGNPVPNYGGDAREWTFELEPDEEGLATLKKHGLSDRLKDKPDAKNPDKGKYIVLRQREFTAAGEKNNPIRVYNKENEAWPEGKLIGNASVGDVKVSIRDFGPGKKKGIYPAAVRVREAVEYTSSEFGRLDGVADKGAPKPKPNTKAKFGDDLDDDLPF